MNSFLPWINEKPQNPANKLPLRRASDDATAVASRPYNERVIPFEKFDHIPVMRRMIWRESKTIAIPTSPAPSPVLYDSPEEENAYFKPRPMDKAEINELMKAGPRKTIRAGSLEGCVKTFLATFRQWRKEQLEKSDSPTRLGSYATAKRIASAVDLRVADAAAGGFDEVSRTLQRPTSFFI